MIRAPFLGLLPQPGVDHRIVVIAHGWHDHVVGAGRVSSVKSGEIVRGHYAARRPARPQPRPAAAAQGKDIALIAFDGAEVIDIAGPASVFSQADQLPPGT